MKPKFACKTCLKRFSVTTRPTLQEACDAILFCHISNWNIKNNILQNLFSLIMMKSVNVFPNQTLSNFESYIKIWKCESMIELLAEILII